MMRVCAFLAFYIAGIILVTGRRNTKSTPSRKFHLQQLKKYEVVHVEMIGHSRPFRLSTLDSHLDHDIGVSPDVLAEFSFSIGDRRLNANVRLHHELFAEGYYEEQRVYKNGIHVGSERKKYDSRSCQYTGFLHDMDETRISDSTVSISNCPHGYLHGLIRSDEAYVIAPAHDYLVESQLGVHARRLQTSHGTDNVNLHLVYKLSDFKNEELEGSQWCGVDDENDDHGHDDEQHSHHTHNTLGNPLSSLMDKPHQPIHGRKLTATNKRVGLLIVNDFRRMTLSSTKNPEAASAAVVDIVQDIYTNANFNPAVVFQLVGQITFQVSNPWNFTFNNKGEVDVDALLYDFHSWRMIPGEVKIEHDNAHLLSGEDFAGPTLGYAGVRSMCIKSSSGGIDMTHIGHTTDSGPVEKSFADIAVILAHEIGHNFGMVHDNPDKGDPTCLRSGFIMNALVGAPPTEFTSCSKRSYNSFIGSANEFCLDNKELTKWGEPDCGNGYLERGEECDCGFNIAEQCDADPCCDGRTCRLKLDMKCSELEPCCSGCNISRSTTICRSSNTFCDTVEYCDGVHSSCPVDRYRGSGTSCTDIHGEGVCYNGICKSRTRQCVRDGPEGTEWSACDLTSGTINPLTYNYCGDLSCESGSGCASFGSGVVENQQTQVDDGIRCSKGKQCHLGTCVYPRVLNPQHHWLSGEFSDCDTCDDKQIRQVDCFFIARTGKQTLTDVAMCSPGDQVDSTRKCFRPKDSETPCEHGANNVADQYARTFANKFDALDKAELLRDLVPRLFGSSEFDANNPEYMKGIVLLGLVPLLIFVLCFLVLVCHCCCRKKRNEDEDGDLKKKHCLPQGDFCQITLPTLLLLIMAIIAFVFSVIGFFYNFELRRGVVGDNGVLDVSNELVAMLPTQISSMSMPINNLQSTMFPQDQDETFLSGVVRQLDVVLLPFEIKHAEVEENLQTIGAINDNLKTYTVPDYIVQCVQCGQISSKLDELTDSFLDSNMLSTATANLLKGRQLVTNLELNIDSNALSPVAEKLNIFEERILNYGKSVRDYSDYIKTSDGVRFPIIAILQLIPFLVILAGIPGWLLKSKKMFHWIHNCSWLIMLLGWLLLAIHLPLGYTFADSCEFMSKVEQDPVKMLNLSALQGRVITTCFADGKASMLLALNLSDEVAFLGQIKKSAFQVPAISVDNLLNIVTSITTLSEALNTNTFEINDGPQTVESLGSSSQAKSLGDQYLQNLRTDLAGLKENINTLASSYYSANLVLKAIGNEMGSLADSGDALVAAAKCGSIGDLYSQFKYMWCDVITTGFSLISFSFLMLALIFTPLIWLSGVIEEHLDNRIRNRKSTKGNNDIPLEGDKGTI